MVSGTQSLSTYALRTNARGNPIQREPVIDILASPPNPSLSAFQIVTPKSPGPDSSPDPIADGSSLCKTGLTFDSPIHQLENDQYASYATDLGAAIARWTRVCFVSPTNRNLQRYADNDTTLKSKEVRRPPDVV
ncbi:hypothetical protein K431DRAFT_298010 [Polychaeton citri CBS 116435]|uniref:Uncharacterized protein n=1 Tax=Polychaeton citri CBS 116435 TaxID=1314669 RepID=A0A9P4Q0H6_9PEZI|nr:hypothetical protein K431DRAFT_298010 [Polychaeton citri CBS 116435]